MVKLTVGGSGKLFMPEHKPIILAQTEGFGQYSYDPVRAKNLPSALETFANPDFVYRPERLKTADRVFIKEFDSLPYKYTVALLGKHKGLRILFTAFPCRKKDVKRWACGVKLYP